MTPVSPALSRQISCSSVCFSYSSVRFSLYSIFSPHVFAASNIDSAHKTGNYELIVFHSQLPVLVLLSLKLCSKWISLFYCNRCLTISYASTPAATEAFSESISPFIGIDAMKSQFSFTSLLTPDPSFPMTRPIGPVKLS